MKRKVIFFLIAVSGVLLVSCNKEKSIDEESVATANNATFSETLFDDVFSTLDIATLYVEKVTATKIETDTCPQIIIDLPTEGSWPKTLTIDYGTSCLGIDNILRSGKVIITVTGPRSEQGSSRSITFLDYYFNGVKIEGTKTVENLGENNDGNIVMGVTLTGGKITLTDGSSVSCEYSREREYIAGFDTYYFWDDECLITGSGSGTGYNGNTFEYSITTPLHWKAVCRFIVSGTIEFSITGVEPFYLDYGSGECDNVATISRDGQTREIRLGLFRPGV